MTSAVVLRDSFARFAITLAVLGALAGCGGSTEPAQPPKDVTPASIAAASTDTIRGNVGASAATQLTVTVKNKAGDPVDSAVVTFAVASGGGTIGGTNVRTNSAGQASTTWTLGPTSGVQTVTATVGTLAPVTFVATAAPGAVAAISKLAGDAQTGVIGTALPVAPSVKVTDKFGNPVPGQLVTFTVGGGGGSLTGQAVNSSASGVATVGGWTLGPTVGANTLIATSGGLTATFSATATVGAPATLTLTPNTGGELLLGQTLALTARVVDAAGNVISNPTVAFATTNAAVATVSASGVITAVGAGTASITATSGAAAASVAVTVVGHPASVTIANTITFATSTPSDVAFTKDAMLIGLNAGQQVLVYDQTGTSLRSTIQLTTPVPMLLAPTRASGPAVAINVGTSSRLWFIDPAAGAVVDSVDIPEAVTGAAMKSDGSRVYAMLADGELAVFDGASHAQITRIQLGGGVLPGKVRVAPGDTTLYALTNVGVIFDVDLRSNTVRRQILSSAQPTDFAISRNGTLFYNLDANASVVRVVDINTGAVLRSVGVSGAATTVALSPDDQQIWVTHTNPLAVTIYQGSVANGYLSAGQILTGTGAPLRVYFSPSGSVAAITNSGGWVDIVR